MSGGAEDRLAARELSELLRQVRARTPARLLTGRAGAAYRTETQMELREAHAAARDAVRVELDVKAAFGSDFLERWGLFEVCSAAKSKDEYLRRPQLGRSFDEASRARIFEMCPGGSDLQLVVGDGLSVAAVCAQAPRLLALLSEGATARGWTLGRPFVVRYCRVGILNEIGEALAPKAVVLLIGERPGLATAESLSAYMAYRPKSGDTDANRNLISNIHGRGVSTADAAGRILRLAERMMTAGSSGYGIRE